MAFLADAVAAQGRPVTYVANQPMSGDRAQLGWQPPSLKYARLEIAPDLQSVEALVSNAPPDSIHICEGIRSNGLVGVAQKLLARRGLKQWVVMETVDDSGWFGFLKRPLYRYHFWRHRQNLSGILATGVNTRSWVVSRGVAEQKVFPFAYFLEAPKLFATIRTQEEKVFRILFVGQLIERKRVDLLISALAALKHENIELVVVGGGPLEQKLRQQGEQQLPGRIEWKGRLPMHLVPNEIATADCLVLPSRHDGWGAVVSEALMVGTPVICSDACGAAVAVKASGVGGVFASNYIKHLTEVLSQQVCRGKVSQSERVRLASWAEALGAQAGAQYLLSILEFTEKGGERPVPPWHQHLS